jgi:hypothetical protein
LISERLCALTILMLRTKYLFLVWIYSVFEKLPHKI